MKIKLSQYTPRKAEGTIIIPKVIILTRKITLEDLPEIYLNLDDIHVMKKDTLTKIVLTTKVVLKRRRTTREDIMIMLKRMMNLPRRELNKKVNIFQVMKSMF